MDAPLTSAASQPHSLVLPPHAPYRRLIGVGGIGSGMLFALQGEHELARNESRPARLLDVRDYCKLHIVAHYPTVLLGAREDSGPFHVVPVGKVVRVQVTSADVMHAFALPSFALKIDAIPGRLNETWFKAEREGVYYGQCSELCGNGHPYMPIEIRVVSEQQYAAWLTEAKQKFASTDSLAPVKLATAQ